ncbi:MAG: ATP-binding cassette domain-containing protein [Sulfurospirillaceae bacterium]|nr:ATP-binding cassette domain-containing protein [Sulfurospirillaceae bacterium]MDD3462895.1 ATP-binding cassette domain-containing protein [Sulfurospirillaceae bacterium]
MSLTCRELSVKINEKVLLDIEFSFRNTFALIGQSGSGKSLTLKALLGMLPQELSVTCNVEASYDLERGKSVSIVPQNPFTSLSPLTKIAHQFLMPLEKAKKYLEMVELEEHFLQRFPSELSGGQLQRVIIAMALCVEPKLLLLDEPTTALDEQTKEHVLALVSRLQKEVGFDLLFVTHDIESVKNVCEEVAVIKDGKIVERADIARLLENPQSEYAKQLIEAGFKHRSFRQ